MSEWWTYTLADLLMFSARTYFRLFELYNRAIWPAQLVGLAIGVALLLNVLRGRAGRMPAVLLALCWLWVAWAFHAERYASISTAAVYFAVGFAVQGLLLLLLSAKDKAEPGAATRATSPAAVGLVLASLVAWPVLAPASGRPWTQAEVIGVAPDPTAIATLGVLLALRGHWLLWPIPLLWCALSSATLATMKAPYAWSPLLAALLALLLAVARGIR
jgi:hypothetical protein